MEREPVIDWTAPLFPAVCLTLMFVTAYGGFWGEALSWVLIAWGDSYMQGETGKALPRRTYLVPPLPKIFLNRDTEVGS